MVKELNKGDVVRSRAGGPLMTVNGSACDRLGGPIAGRVKCIWFESVHLREGTFAEETLQRWQPVSDAG